MDTVAIHLSHDSVLAVQVDGEVRNLELERIYQKRHKMRVTKGPIVRREWRDTLAAAVHIDRTARVQTVTSSQNAWLFAVLTEFERLSGFGVLVNTSFNTKGRPMVTRIVDALDLFLSTDLDCLVIESWLFSKRRL